MRSKITFLLFISILFVSCSSNNNKNYEFNFTELETNSDASLRGLYVVDENVVWASGSKGTVLRSTNGGETWNVVGVDGAEKNDFRSIHAWDENRAMVFGIAGPEFGYKTIDGGKSWEVVFQDSTKGLFFNSIKFADDIKGLAVSDPIDGKFYVIRTEDGGANWERVDELPKVEEGEANFAASNTCIEFLPSGKAWIASGGKAARVFYSVDSGKSWMVAKTPMVRGQASSGIFSISFKNDREGVIVGGTYDSPELNQNIASYTFDGGITWLPAEKMPNEYRSCVQLVSTEKESIFFAIGKTGCDYSLDGGINWNFIGEKGNFTFRAVPGQFGGFAAGGNGRIVKIGLNR